MNPVDFGLPTIESDPITEILNGIFAKNDEWNTASVNTNATNAFSGKTYVIVDDSYSVRNYLQDYSHSLSFADFMDTVFNNVENATFLTLCQGEQKDLDSLRNNIHLEEFYRQSLNQQITPIYSYLKELFDEHDDVNENLYVLVTDLVMSGEVDHRGVPQAFINLLDTHFLSGDDARNTTVGVIGAKLDYRGPFSDLPKLNIDSRGLFHSDNLIAPLSAGEALPIVRPEYVNNGNPVKRPFFALVMGDSDKVNDFVERVTIAYNSFEQYPNAETAILGTFSRSNAERPQFNRMIIPDLYIGIEPPDALQVRVASLMDSGILSSFSISSSADVVLRDELQSKSPVLLISDRMSYDLAENLRIRIPTAAIGYGVAVKGLWSFKSPDPSSEFDDEPPPAPDMIESRYLIDFGDKSGYREFGIQRSIIESLELDTPIFFAVELEFHAPTELFAHDSSSLPDWIGQWDLNLGVYLAEAYHNINGRYEFILGRIHLGRSYTVGRVYSQYDRTPFLLNIFEGLNNQRASFLEYAVNNDTVTAETKVFSQVFCFGIVRRLSYSQYLSEMGVGTKYVRPYHTEDFGFAFPEISPDDDFPEIYENTESDD
jgi:hypothetical protein